MRRGRQTAVTAPAFAAFPAELEAAPPSDAVAAAGRRPDWLADVIFARIAIEIDVSSDSRH